MSVFWCPTADWFVSGATTVTSPIGSRASLSASSPRDSMPSSLVTRIRGRVDQSPSARARPLSDRGLPRVPATGSPRSLSRSRRSARARSRVMSGPAPAPFRLRPPSSVTRRAPPPAGRCRRGPGAGRRGRRARRSAAAVATSSTSGSTPGTGSRGRRTSRPSRARPASPPGRPRCRLARSRDQWKNNAEITAAIGIPKIAPAMPAIFEPMTTETSTTIGWMPTEPDISRGWRMFIVTNQPMPMRTSTGRRVRSGMSMAATTGGSPRDERPEERDHLEEAGEGGRQRGVGEAETRC